MFRKRIHVVSEKSPSGQWRPCRTCPLQQDAITSILQVAHNRTDLKIFYWLANWKYQHRSIAPPQIWRPVGILPIHVGVAWIRRRRRFL